MSVSHYEDTKTPTKHANRQTLPNPHSSTAPLPFPAALRQIQSAGHLILKAGDSELHEMEANPAASLTDDLLVEILRRLPVRSLCRFKCVSRSWRDLISDPAHRKKLPQTLAGFFYSSWNGERFPSSAHHLTNITGKGAPLIFPSSLPVPSGNVVTLLDSCNGLLLCCFQPGPHEGDGSPPFHYAVCNPAYAVCNPATNKWVMLPDAVATGETGIARLGFDLAVSSHFHVVEFVYEEECVTGVEIYSSKTAAWSFKESEWGDNVMLNDEERSVFLNGFMHILRLSGNVSVMDMEGKTWRTILAPHDCDDGCIHQSQGRLCFLGVDDDNPSKLSIWILEDHGSDEWTLKHSVRIQFLFGKHLMVDLDCTVITVHPECNLIYFVYGSDNTLMAYDMGRKEVCVIRNLGHECRGPYLPYVPWFAAALADGQ